MWLNNVWSQLLNLILNIAPPSDSDADNVPPFLRGGAQPGACTSFGAERDAGPWSALRYDLERPRKRARPCRAGAP